MDDRKALFAATTAAARGGRNTSEGSSEEGEGDRYHGLLNYVKRHLARNDDLNLGEVFQTMSRKDHQRMWKTLLDVVQPIMEEARFLPCEDEDEGEEEDENQEIGGGGGDVDNAEQGMSGGENIGGRHRAKCDTPDRARRDSRVTSVGGEEGSDDCPSKPTRRGRTKRSSSGADPGGRGGKGRELLKRTGESVDDVSLALDVLYAVALMAQEFLSDKGCVAPRALLEIAVSMHSVMLSLQDLQGLALQSVIAKICEMWWIHERPGGEHLVTQLLPLMLVRSLDADAKEADVKRMHGLKTALLLLDFDDEDSEGLRALLLRTYISPIYLRSTDGKRFLAYLFGLHPSLITDIHAVMKEQMIGAKRGVLSAYGEIYFKVWRGAKGTYLEKLELQCLQDLMHACIHASTPKMHSNLLIVLGGMHSQKKVKGVDAVLLRLYGPVLWRALRVANAAVRAQACQVLVDAFPLQDRTAGGAAQEAVLQQQFDALTRLLEDGHPQVRAVAAKGACRILSVYWEMIPMPTTRALLARVVGRLASDASSPAVRHGAVEGLTLLLGCPESHSVLKAMLPGVSNLIHDTNKKVRLAFINLLNRVKGIQSIEFYHVVPMDHILARLAEDHHKYLAAADGLIKLLLDSYFPTGTGITGSVQVQKCLALVAQDERAAMAFYSGLHHHAGVPSAAKVLTMLARCVIFASDASDEDTGGEQKEHEKEQRQRQKGSGKGTKAKGSRRSKRKTGADCDGEEVTGRQEKGVARVGEHVLRASDTKTMSAVMGLICSIWESILPGLEKTVNEPSLDLIQQTITGEALTLLHRRFSRVDDECCRGAFLRLAGLAGGDLAPEMLEDVVVEMLALPEDAPLSVYGPTVDLLCSWKKHERLVSAVLDSLRIAFSNVGTGNGDGSEVETTAATPSSTTTVSRGKRRRAVSKSDGARGKRGGGNEKDAGSRVPPLLALSMLSHFLAGGNGHARTAGARDEILADGKVIGSLEEVLFLACAVAESRLASASACANAMKSRSGIVAGACISRAGQAADQGRARCPDALVVRAVEALGRLYMHMEAVAAGNVGHSRSSRGDEGGGGETAEAQADEGEEQPAMLLPMPFSVKMRELMVWTTDVILPVLTLSCSSGGNGADASSLAPPEGTPVKGAARIVAESPSPMPPPRSRARASRDRGSAAVSIAAASGKGAAVSNGTDNGGEQIDGSKANRALAHNILGVVILLASEWVEVGSGLAEVSLRADAWGQRLLTAVLEEEETGRESIAPVLPQLCRLSHQLSLRESQGARPPASLWEVLLRCADCGVHDGEGMVDAGRSACVQKFLAATIALQAKREGLDELVGSLLSFVFTQASPTSAEEETAGDVSILEDDDNEGREAVEGDAAAPSSRGGSLHRYLRVQACLSDIDGETNQDRASAGERSNGHPVNGSSSAMRLSGAGSAVFSVLARSSLACSTAGTLALSHLEDFRPADDQGDESWPGFCAHVLSALLDHSPVRARLGIAAEAHASLKKTSVILASASAPNSVLAFGARGTHVGGDESGQENPEEEVPVAMEDSRQPTLPMRQGAAWAMEAIYRRLEAARQAAAVEAAASAREARTSATVGGDDDDNGDTEGHTARNGSTSGVDGCGISEDRVIRQSEEQGDDRGAAGMCLSPTMVRISA